MLGVEVTFCDVNIETAAAEIKLNAGAACASMFYGVAAPSPIVEVRKNLQAIAPPVLNEWKEHLREQVGGCAQPKGKNVEMIKSALSVQEPQKT